MMGWFKNLILILSFIINWYVCVYMLYTFDWSVYDALTGVMYEEGSGGQKAGALGSLCHWGWQVWSYGGWGAGGGSQCQMVGNLFSKTLIRDHSFSLQPLLHIYLYPPPPPPPVTTPFIFTCKITPDPSLPPPRPPAPDVSGSLKTERRGSTAVGCCVPSLATPYTTVILSLSISHWLYVMQNYFLTPVYSHLTLLSHACAFHIDGM